MKYEFPGLDILNEFRAENCIIDSSGERPVIPVKRILSSVQFTKSGYKLPAGLGLDIDNKEVIFDITKTPHLLIAGSTGSGKSVCINVILLSLIYCRKPSELKFILIDPKRVELSLYSNAPFLLNPIICEADESVELLNKLVDLMEERYTLLSENKCRDIVSYNKKSKAGGLPYIVAVIDEFADLIMQKKEIEEPVCRLAQLSRAVGIHLIIATQRPSVDIITGRIKTNFPSRIAFQVFSSVDSKVILDEKGAEELLGRGDFLFKDSVSKKMVRGQCCFASDEEIEKVTEFIKVKDVPILKVDRKEKTADPVNRKVKHADGQIKRKSIIEYIKLIYLWVSVLFKNYFREVCRENFGIKILFLFIFGLFLTGGIYFEKIISVKNRLLLNLTEKNIKEEYVFNGTVYPELMFETDEKISFIVYDNDIYIFGKNETGENVVLTNDSIIRRWRELCRNNFDDIRIISDEKIFYTKKIDDNEFQIFTGTKKELKNQIARQLTFEKNRNLYPSYSSGLLYFVSDRLKNRFRLFKLQMDSGRKPVEIRFPYKISYAGTIHSGILPLVCNGDIYIYYVNKNIYQNMTCSEYEELSPSIIGSGKYISFIRKIRDNICQLFVVSLITGNRKEIIIPGIEKENFISQIFDNSGKNIYLLTKSDKYRLYRLIIK